MRGWGGVEARPGSAAPSNVGVLLAVPLQANWGSILNACLSCRSVPHVLAVKAPPKHIPCCTASTARAHAACLLPWSLCTRRYYSGLGFCALAVKGSDLASWSLSSTGFGAWSSSLSFMGDLTAFTDIFSSLPAQASPLLGEPVSPGRRGAAVPLTTCLVAAAHGFDALTALLTPCRIQATQYYLMGSYATGIPGLVDVPGLPGPVEVAGAINFCLGDYLFGR